ncbi:MAG: hypothetical protein NTV44_01935 [Firmicutes bacterium]|nr:hypothetical protein [Bacillota bacterium]
MNKKLQNFMNLFSDDDKVVYQAILAKKDWLFVPLFLPGNTMVYMDERNLRHYRLLEAIYDDVLPFDKILLDTKIPVKSDVKLKVESDLKEYRKLVLMDAIPNDNTPFFAEYDFTKLNEETYHALVANFYPCLSVRSLSIDLSLLETSLIEKLKSVMVGKKGEHVLIVDQSVLLNDSLYAPMLRAIHVRPNADPVLQEELRLLCKEKGIIYKEVHYD